AVPFLGELCVIDVVQDGRLVRQTVASTVPELLGPGATVPGQAIDLHPDHPAARAIATGEAVTTVIDAALWRKVAPSAPASSQPGRASLNLPLRIRGKVAGAISFLSWEREYDEGDVAAGLEFARRAALALDNARLYQDAELANRSKDEFLATLSHELRTPMTSILGWSRLLEMDAVDDPNLVAEAATSIRKSAETQAQLIDDLLDVSRIVAGKMRVNIETVSLGTVVEAAIDTVGAAAEARGIQIVTDIDPAVTVRGDAARLQQIVWNLFSNAVKFTPRGGTVMARVDRNGSDARIAVTDTGEGIPAEFLPHMFERFRQLESGSRRSQGGLGLGLSIVRHLVELHGGTISASSAGPGKGATFTILLPVAAAFDGADTTRTVSRAARKAALDSMPDLSYASLLLVEDDPESRRVIATILRAAGAEVRQAASVAEARRELELRRPDLVVSDIAMPDEDGYDMIKDLRTRYRADPIPTIALTAFGQPEERERILAAGFDRYLMKPVDPLALTVAVASILTKA
ncbi:MAG TPA: ATP-binding protein, partial [Thermoanaerobaculia bacterium]|nr:ATP-binding protein [Thermoanaerobaculia bacterium]